MFEELNRKVLDHLSDINFPLTEHARKYLIQKELNHNKVGSPMKEILDYHKNDIDRSKILSELGLNKNEFFIVSCHREENVDSPENFNNLLNSLNAIAKNIIIQLLFQPT